LIWITRIHMSTDSYR